MYLLLVLNHVDDDDIAASPSLFVIALDHRKGEMLRSTRKVHRNTDS
jgi:hypothetical protein